MLKDLLEIYEYEGNLAETLTDDTLNKIGSEVIDGFDEDLETRSAWDGDMKDAMALAMQIKEKKDFPWENASNVKIPLLTEAAIQFWSRMMPALVPTKDLVKSRVIGEDHNGEKQKQGIRVSKFMSYQILEQMEDWEPEMSVGMMVLPILGNMYKKTFLGSKMIESIMLTPAELVVNNNAKSLESAQRVSHILYKTKNEIKKEVLRGSYLDVDLGEPKAKTQNPTEDSGTDKPVQSKIDSTTPYKFIEQVTYLDLDEDGLDEPYIVTVEYYSKKTVAIEPCFDLDGIETNEDGVVIDVVKIQYYTKYGFIPNPDGGIMDLGLGKLLAPTNESVNTIINQLLDRGTLNNLGGGFLGRGARVKGGKIRRVMGQYTRVDATGDDLRKNIYEFPTIEPSAVLFSLLQLLMNSGQRLASTLDSQIGEDPGQNQKATTTMAVQEQGQKIFNGIYKGQLKSLNREVKKIFILNSKFMPSESYLNVLDLEVDPEMGDKIFKADFDLDSVNIVASADPNYSSKQDRMNKAQALMEMMTNGMVNPQVAIKSMLEAQEQPNIEELMQMPEQQPSLEEMEFERDTVLREEEIDIEWEKLDQADRKTQAEIILLLAKAESEEEGTQMNEYHRMAQTLNSEYDAVTKRQQLRQQKQQQRQQESAKK